MAKKKSSGQGLNAKCVKKSLVEQLKNKGADVALYLDQIEDYMFFFQQEKAMQADVRKHGISYPAMSAAGKSYIKDNPSIKSAMLYSKQKLAILNSLGLSTDKIIGAKSPGDDECDL